MVLRCLGICFQNLREVFPRRMNSFNTLKNAPSSRSGVSEQSLRLRKFRVTPSKHSGTLG